MDAMFAEAREDLRVWFEIRTDGSVSWTGVNHRALVRDDSVIEACINGIVRRWVFGLQKGEALAMFRVFPPSGDESVLLLEPSITTHEAPPIDSGGPAKTSAPSDITNAFEALGR